MLPKENRLTTKEWNTVYANGRRIKSPYFAMVYHKTQPKTPNKIGISVPKKRAKTAVLRNKIKRSILLLCDMWAREMNGLHVEIIVNNYENMKAFEKELKNTLNSFV